MPRSPIWQTAVAGVLSWIILVTLGHSVGLTAGVSQISLVAATATASFWYLRGPLGVGVWIAVPCSWLYLCHPLCVATIMNPTESASVLYMLLVPLAWAITHQVCAGLGVKASLALGAALGTGLALDTTKGGLLLLITAVYGFMELFISNHARMLRARWKRLVLSIAIVAIAGTFVTFSLPGVAAQVGLPLPTEEAAPEGASSFLTAPFASVDREGLLASRLGKLPRDLTARGGTDYFGWTIIVLCLIAAWPSRSRGADGTRRVAALLILGLGLAWLARGPESLHAQLVRMFEFATLRHHVAPLTLHLLGLEIVPLALLGVLAFLAVGSLHGGRRRWTIGAVIVATSAVMVWWGTSVPSLFGSTNSLPAAVGSPAAHSAPLAFSLVCGAAAGLHRACAGVRTRCWRFALWLGAIALIAGDVCPYGQAETSRARDAAPRPTVGIKHGSVVENEGECAQVSLIMKVSGSAEPTWCATPSCFITLSNDSNSGVHRVVSSAMGPDFA